MMRPLTEIQIDVLGALAAFHRNMAKLPGWENHGARPLDLGGSNGSHHSTTLRALVQKGLVHRDREARRNGTRPGCLYWITPAGVDALEKLKEPSQ